MRETSNLEFKREITNTFLKTVSAFANFQNGSIVFGVADDGTIVGLEDTTRAALDIENRINDSISPKPDFSVDVNARQGTVTVAVKHGRHKPYLYRGKAYRRADSSTTEVDAVELRRLVLEGENLSFDELPASQQSLSFTTLEARMQQALNIQASNTDLLKTLSLIKDGSYTNAAALLADTNSFPGLDIARFGASISTILDRFTVTGMSILDQLEAATQRYELHYCQEIIDGPVRKRVESVPATAFREAVANALVHRTWDVNTNIRISMFSDRIEVSSPGGLPTGLSAQEYLAGRVSNPRNPIIADVFFRLGLIEKFGTGILRIKEAYSSLAEKPQFDIQANSITVVLPVVGAVALTIDERKLLAVMNSNRFYGRAELDALSGFQKTKTVRILNRLAALNLVSIEGTGRGRTYRKQA